MTRRGRPSARSLRWLGFASVAGLGAFHADLLRQRLLDASILEPAVALRWLVTVLVVAGFAALRARGVSLLGDRRALGPWLAVLLLHAGVAPGATADPAWLALPTLTVAGVAAVELLGRATADAHGPAAPVPLGGREDLRPSSPPGRRRRFLPRFLPRPPPFPESA